MKECLSENCILTSEIGELRRRLLGKSWFHDRAVAVAPDETLLRIKLATPVLGELNRPDVIQRLIDYANWFLTNGVLNHCVSDHGRARRGERAYSRDCGQKLL